VKCVRPPARCAFCQSHRRLSSSCWWAGSRWCRSWLCALRLPLGAGREVTHTRLLDLSYQRSGFAAAAGVVGGALGLEVVLSVALGLVLVVVEVEVMLRSRVLEFVFVHVERETLLPAIDSSGVRIADCQHVLGVARGQLLASLSGCSALHHPARALLERLDERPRLDLARSRARAVSLR